MGPLFDGIARVVRTFFDGISSVMRAFLNRLACIYDNAIEIAEEIGARGCTGVQICCRHSGAQKPTMPRVAHAPSNRDRKRRLRPLAGKNMSAASNFQ
jgi:hypothetical protein